MNFIELDGEKTLCWSNSFQNVESLTLNDDSSSPSSSSQVEEEAEENTPTVLSTSVPNSGVVESKGDEDIKFPISKEINDKIFCVHGNICRITNLDCVVNPTNERLNDLDGISGTIYSYAGRSALTEECLKEHPNGCRTGESVITRGGNLAVHKIIHTVGPRWSKKYETAAENALHSCYKSSLIQCVENTMRTIALPCLYKSKKNYPREEAAHVAARTVRRFLEKYTSKMDKVIFCLSSAEEYERYIRILKLYFPRNHSEVRQAQQDLPDHIGNEDGELVIAERRIGAGLSDTNEFERTDNLAGANDPNLAHFRGLSDNDTGGSNDLLADLPDERNDDGVPLNQQNVDFVQDGADFRSLHSQDPNDRRIRESNGTGLLDAEEAQTETEWIAESVYADYLIWAEQEDLSDIASSNFIYLGGKDKVGRQSVIILARNIPASTALMDRILLYLIKIMDPVVQREYVVVFFESGMEKSNQPTLKWLQSVHAIFNRRYKKNMKKIYYVHPTMWTRAMSWVITPWVKWKVWRKLVYINTVESLFQHFETDQIRLPRFAVEYERTMNGL